MQMVVNKKSTEQQWVELGQHIRLLTAHPDAKGADGTNASNLFTLPDNPLPSQQEFENLIHEIFDPASFENTEAATYALECFVAEYFLRRELGFRYAAVAAYLYCPRPQHFLHEQGVLRCSFMVGSKYPHIDHPAEGAVQMPPWFVENHKPVHDHLALKLSELLTNTSKVSEEYADLLTIDGLVSILKQSEMVRSFLLSRTFIESPASSSRSPSEDDYRTLVNFLQTYVLNAPEDEQEIVPSKIGKMLGNLANYAGKTILPFAKEWSPSSEDIEKKIRRSVGFIVGQIIVEICLSSLSGRNAKIGEQKHLSESLIVLDRHIREQTGPFLLLPSPVVQQIFRQGIGSENKWAIAIRKLPQTYTQAPDDAFLICLLNEDRFWKDDMMEENDLLAAIDNDLVQRLVDCMLPLGRAAVATETRESYVKSERQRVVANHVYASAHRLGSALGDLLRCQAKVNELLEKQPSALLKEQATSLKYARVWARQATVLTSGVREAANCMVFMAALSQASYDLSKLNPTKWMAPKGINYSVENGLRKILNKLKSADWQLSLSDDKLANLSSLFIDEEIETATEKRRLWDGFYDDMFFEILHNAAHRKVTSMEVTYEMIPCQLEDQERSIACIVFSNPTVPKTFDGLRLKEQIWTEWCTEENGPQGALRYIAIRLRETMQGNLFVKYEIENGTSWFRIAAFIQGLKSGGGADA
jgi:hypothetical protein